MCDRITFLLQIDASLAIIASYRVAGLYYVIEGAPPPDTVLAGVDMSGRL